MVKRLWILAGGNGSGKSTFYQEFLKNKSIPFVNADNIAKSTFPGGTLGDSVKARDAAHEEFHTKIESGISFCYETVFSHESKLEMVEKAKSLGYEVTLIFLHLDLDNADLNVARVKQRVDLGGHNVPEDRIRKRIPKTLENMKTAAKLVDNFLIYDNSDPDNRFRSVLKMKTSEKGIEIDYLSQGDKFWSEFILG